MMNIAARSRARGIDYAGAVASWVCAAHCLALPMLLSIGSIAGISFFANEISEYVLIAFSMMIAGISFAPGALRYGRYAPLVLFAFGISMIAFADAISEDLIVKTPVVVVGAGLITAAHVRNLRFHGR